MNMFSLIKPAPRKQTGPDATFSGYASLFGVAALARDVVEPGTFAASLARRGTRGIRMLLQHDPALEIGAWLDIAEDDRGLHVCGRLATGTDGSREALAMMRAGRLDGLSIGFRTVRALYDETTGLRHLFEVDLMEVSLVANPLLRGARITNPRGNAP